MTLSMFEDADTLDPTFAGTAGAREVFINMCDRLFDLDPQGNLIPQLASAMPKVSADGLTVTIEIRSGAKFNDGTPMDVASVVSSLERHRTFEGSRRKSELANVSKIEASGANAIVLTLNKPDSSLAATLSDRAGHGSCRRPRSPSSARISGPTPCASGHSSSSSESSAITSRSRGPRTTTTPNTCTSTRSSTSRSRTRLFAPPTCGPTTSSWSTGSPRRTLQPSRPTRSTCPSR